MFRARAEKRPGWVYCIRVRRRGLLWWLPAPGYIGQTRHSDYRTRIYHHLYGHERHGEWVPPAWWAADAVDYYPMYYSARVTDRKLDRIERRRIRWCRPLHNIRSNDSNPRRVVAPPEWARVYPTEGQITARERPGYAHRMSESVRRRRVRETHRGGLFERRLTRRRDGAVKVQGRGIRTRIYRSEDLREGSLR